ncbi:unnamed protein product [Prunus brigantina]
MKVITDKVNPKVPDQMKHFLIKPYNKNEVEFVLNETPPSKAPGIDGMPAVFSRNIGTFLGTKLLRYVSSISAIPIVEFHEKYLGLPTVIGRKKKDCFNGIKERLRQKLNGWKEKLLSKVGKALLIKAVAQSIPNYAIGVFKLPITFCVDLNSMISKFLWKNS